FARDADRLQEAPRDLGERREEEIPEAVARQLPVSTEPELKELGHQGLDLRQRDETVAQIARREHLELLPEPARTAAVVGDGDDGGERRDATAEIALQRREHHREPRPAPDRDDPPPAAVSRPRRHGLILAHAGSRTGRTRQPAEPGPGRSERRGGGPLEAAGRERRGGWRLEGE